MNLIENSLIMNNNSFFHKKISSHIPKVINRNGHNSIQSVSKVSYEIPVRYRNAGLVTQLL